MKEGDVREVRRSSGHANDPAIQVICLGSGGGPSEDNVTGFLVRSTATQWSKNSVIAVDAGSHLAAITRILEKDFPLVSDPEPPISIPFIDNGNGNGNGNGRESEPTSPTTALASLSDDETGPDTPVSELEVPVTITTLKKGAFAGLAFPHASARANALHVVREHISTYLITHPHLDHVSGFVINTAAFHNTSRPKRLAALPFTVNAIKNHIFNNVIWPNLTDEDGGVGLVTFQRLAEGGNIALGEGSGRGFIEVCDGLGVKGFKVSHGHCMRGPGHVNRGSNASLPETPSIQRAATDQLHAHVPELQEGRSLSFSLPTQSLPGTPGLHATTTATTDPAHRSSGPSSIPPDHCVVDSTAYFIRAEPTPTTPKREVLLFGDVEPDSLSLFPRTCQIWSEAAPKIAAGILRGIFIEVSYTNAQADAVLFGHLNPRHLLAELSVLASKVRDAKHSASRERDEARRLRKRKRVSNPLQLDADGLRKTKTLQTGRPPGADPPQHGTAPHMLDAAEEAVPDMPHLPDTRDATGTHTPLSMAMGMPASSASLGQHPPLLSHAALPTAAAAGSPAACALNTIPSELNRAMLTAAFEAPLKGLTVVVIHVKDTFADGPLVGDTLLRELVEGERALAEQGKGLGCVFEVSKSGESYWF
ncbi:elongation factor EF-1 gamma subunit [Coniothyrium glycines]